MSSLNRSALAAVGDQTLIVSIGRTRIIASRCARACAPEPTSVSRVASGLAR